jgi:hypothetical protein
LAAASMLHFLVREPITATELDGAVMVAAA